jgi:hypothetical protein
MDLEGYSFCVREDFSLLAVPMELVKPPSVVDRSNLDQVHSADKGFVIGSVARRKIRSAAYNLYLNATRDEQLKVRFVTFTFPSLPDNLCTLDFVSQDIILHRLFLKFLDNERKNYGLDKWLWVNERQSGDRKINGESSRGVVHYHCLFRYSFNPIDYTDRSGYIVDYWLANVRWLNLLRRNGFVIFNSAFFDSRFSQRRSIIEKELSELDYRSIYDRFKKGDLNIYTQSGKQSVFLQPLDFDKKPIDNIVALSKYLAAYISKDSKKSEESYILETYFPDSVVHDVESEKELNKIYARRWGCSRGLVTRKEYVCECFAEQFGGEIVNDAPFSFVDETTGELVYRSPERLHISDKRKLLNFYTLDRKVRVNEFELDIGGKSFRCFYFPPCFELWSQVPEYCDFFKASFGFNFV